MMAAGDETSPEVAYDKRTRLLASTYDERYRGMPVGTTSSEVGDGAKRKGARYLLKRPGKRVTRPRRVRSGCGRGGGPLRLGVGERLRVRLRGLPFGASTTTERVCGRER